MENVVRYKLPVVTLFWLWHCDICSSQAKLCIRWSYRM